MKLASEYPARIRVLDALRPIQDIGGEVLVAALDMLAKLNQVCTEPAENNDF